MEVLKNWAFSGTPTYESKVVKLIILGIYIITIVKATARQGKLKLLLLF